MSPSKSKRTTAARKSGRSASRPARDAAVDRRAQIALWLMTFSVLAWVPGGFSRFVVAKCLVVTIACAVGATVPARTRLDRRISILFGVGAAIFLVAAVAGETPWASLVGRWPRYEGLPVLGLYAGAAWLGARLIDSARRFVVVLTATAAMSCVLGVFSALDAIGWSPLGPSALARDGSLLGNATDQGLVAMIAVVLLARPAYDTMRELYLFGIAGATVTVALSGSRAALLLTAVSLIALALRERRRLVVPALVSVGALATVAVALPQSRDRLANVDTLHGRWLEWGMAARAFGDHPVLGIGPSRFVDVVGGYENQAWVDWSHQQAALDSPHNWILQVLLAGGLPLLACAATLVVVTVRVGMSAVRQRPELVGVLVAVASYGIAMLANFTNPASTCWAAFLAGALVASPRLPKQPPERKETRWVASAIAGAAAVAFVSVSVSEIVLQRGLDRAASDHGAGAGKLFDQALSLRPGDPDAHMIAAQGMAALTSRTGEKESARRTTELARTSLDATPDTYESRVALAVGLLAQGRADDAVHNLDQAIAKFPFRTRAFVQRAIALATLGHVGRAMDDLDRAIELGDQQARRLKRQFRNLG